MCFGGGKDSSSKEMIRLQKEEAAAARLKEQEREQRLTEGLSRIKNMFQGSPIMKNVTTGHTFDWNAFKPTAGSAVSGLPAGYKYLQLPGTPGTPGTVTPGVARTPVTSAAPAPPVSAAPTSTIIQPPRTSSGYQGGKEGTGASVVWIKDRPGRDSSPSPYVPSPNGLVPATAVTHPGHDSGVTYTATAPTPATPGAWAIQGPDGRIYKQGEAINWSTTDQQDTGQREGGFDDAFYNKYRKAITDYYTPQIAKEYGKAQDETLYRLARAGTTKSTAANQAFADLSSQNVQQKEKMKNQADVATGELKGRVAGEQQKAISQLYATENPEVAANTALASLRNISAEQPTLSPLSDIFNIATIGTAGALQGYQNAKYRQQIPGYQKSTTITNA